jgi:hypothetical protein
MDDDQKLRQVWNQLKIPVIVRGSGTVHLRLPWARDERDWLRGDHARHPLWVADKRHWVIPQKWLNKFVDRALHKYGQLYIIQPYREKETCTAACQDTAAFYRWQDSLGPHYQDRQPGDPEAVSIGCHSDGLPGAAMEQRGWFMDARGSPAPARQAGHRRTGKQDRAHRMGIDDAQRGLPSTGAYRHRSRSCRMMRSC